MAKWPQLVLPQFCHTSVTLTVESEDIGENGAPSSLLKWSGKCNYQDKAKRVYNVNKELVEVTGSCLIPGDIAPDMAVIPGGTVNVYGIDRKLAIGTKARNPDGTVNYTRLELV